MIEVSGLGSLKKVRRRGRVSHGFMDGRQRMATIDRDVHRSFHADGELETSPHGHPLRDAL